MAQKSENKKTQDLPPREVDIHYIKTASYRTYHVDGVFGGTTASRKIYAEFFVQRPVTPKVTRHAVTPEGMIVVEPLSQEGKTGIVREIEAGIVMDVYMAIALREWLDKYIKAIQENEGKGAAQSNVPDATK